MKSQLRDRMLASRSELDDAFINRASLEVQRRALLMDELRISRRVGLYYPKRGDVDTQEIFKQLTLRRHEVYYPLVQENKLVYCRVLSAEELHPRQDGLCQPKPGVRELRDVSELDVIFVPGLAFNKKGERLGFGGGRWDRCLETFGGKRIALVFDFQVVAELPRSVRGRKVDWIVTESRLILCQEG